MILVRLERSQGIKFESEKERFKNEKEKKVNILHFYWNENLNSL